MKSYICALLIVAAFCRVQAQKPQYEIEIRRADTSLGKITVEMFPAIAPNHVRNWDSLVTIKFYDSLAIHRVVPDWVIQGGDPNTRSGPKDTWGFGSDGQTTIDAEFSAVSHLPGILSAARTPDPNSATSQFFICVADDSQLDRDYSVYGQVINGMDVVYTIVESEVDDGDIPLEKIIMFITKIGTNDELTATPDLIAPVPNENLVPAPSVIFIWNSVSGAMLYELQIASNGDFTNIVVDTSVSQVVTGADIPLGHGTYFWRVRANNGGNVSEYSTVRSFTLQSSDVARASSTRLALDEAYPHPARNGATLGFSLEQPGEVRLSLHDVLGRTVQTIIDGQYLYAGHHAIEVSLDGLSAGVYTYRLEAGSVSVTKQLIVQ